MWVLSCGQSLSEMAEEVRMGEECLKQSLKMLCMVGCLNEQ